MKAHRFPQETMVLAPPAGKENHVNSLAVWSDGKICVSRWRPESIWEFLRFLWKREVWVGIYSGQTQPPIFLTGHSPFVGPIALGSQPKELPEGRQSRTGIGLSAIADDGDDLP